MLGHSGARHRGPECGNHLIHTAVLAFFDEYLKAGNWTKNDQQRIGMRWEHKHPRKKLLSAGRKAHNPQSLPKMIPRPLISTRDMCRTRNVRVALLLLVFGLLTACKTSQEAASAANQLTNTTLQLTAYYTDLSNQVADFTTLSEMHSELMFQQPLDSSVRSELNTTEQELAKRLALAQALGKLASAYSALATSKAATDISTAASGLASECKAIAPLPGGSAIPDIVGQAAQQLVEYLRAKKLRQSSEAVSKIVAGIQQMFVSEMTAYESLNRRRVEMAQRVARELIKKDVVEINPDLSPALKPFALNPKPVPSPPPAELRSLQDVGIQRSGERQTSEFAANTQALSQSLKAASEQVKLVTKRSW